MRNFIASWLIICGLVGCSTKSSAPDSATNTPSLKPNHATTLDVSSHTSDAEKVSPADGPKGDLLAGEAPGPVEVFVADIGRLQSLRDSYKGRVVVLDIWSTSCLPCMKEFPHLVELANRWPEDLVCIALNVDYIGLPNKKPEDYLPAVKEFLVSKSANSSNLVNLISAAPDEQVFGNFDIEALPAIIVFDRAGNLVKKLTVDTAGEDGLTYAGDVIPLVEQLIESR